MRKNRERERGRKTQMKKIKEMEAMKRKANQKK